MFKKNTSKISLLSQIVGGRAAAGRGQVFCMDAKLPGTECSQDV
jgi:hypothetical protein